MSNRKQRRQQQQPTPPKAPTPAEPVRVRRRVADPDEAPAEPAEWWRSSGGVLRRALEEHGKQPYRDLLIIGQRGASAPEVLSFTPDALRALGLLAYAEHELQVRLRSRE